ncbi:MAG: PAS domain S-box protein [Myxococcales bacterium]|jgi:PAS domain S-box-containing protein
MRNEGESGQVDGLVSGEASGQERLGPAPADEALRSDRDFIAAVLDTTVSLVLVFDREGRIVRFNKACVAATGYTASEVLGKHYGLLVPDDEAPTVRRLLEGLTPGGLPVSHENHLRAKDGTLRLFSWSNTAIPDEAGQVRFVVSTGVDITDRRRAEEALRASEEKFRSVFEQAAFGIGRVRFCDARWIDVNEAFCRMLGYSQAEMLSTPWTEITHADDLDLDLIPFRRMAAGELDRYTIEKRFIHKQGHHVWARLMLSLVRDARGRPDYEIAVIEDITDRKLAEQRLQESRAKLEAALASMTDAVFITDNEGRFVEVNDAFKLFRTVGGERFPKSVAELQSLLEIFLPDGTPVPAEEWTVARALRGETAANAELVLRRKDTGQSWFASFGFGPIRDETGAIVGAVVVARDITAMKQAEQALRRSEATLSTVLDALPAGVVIADAEGRIVRYNAACREIWGDMPEAASWRDYGAWAAWSPESGERLKAEDWAMTRALLHGEETRSQLLQFQRFDGGERRNLLNSVAPLRDAEGRIVGGVGALLDVTERLSAEQALRESEERFRLVLDGAADSFFLHDFEGRFVDVNRRACESLGYSREELLRLRVQDVEADFDETRDPPIWDKLRPGEPFKLNGRHRRKDGTVFPVEIHFSVVEVRGQRLIGGLARDMTERERADAEVRKANAKLVEADRRKTEFLAVLSHELRNPLSPIASSLYVLDRATPGSDQARHAREVIDRQVQHMTRLIGDLLDVTRISRGKITLQRSRVDLNALALATLEDHRELFLRNGVGLEFEGAGEPLWVDGDPTRLSQVIGNLLQNAAKFTPRGGQAVLAIEASSPAEVLLRVRDNGNGIPPEMLEQVFEPFVQGAQTLERSRGGLGLGLALVKGLVEMRGGTARAQSAGEGQGTEILVTLPLLAPAGARVAPPASTTGKERGRRVLVIEDHVDAADSLREVLELGNHEVAVAYSGPEGVARAREYRPEVVLCDIGLPGLDGYGVARALRADSDPKVRSAFLVALSGYALPEDVEKSKQAGFDRHVAKPPDIEELEELIASAPA